MAGTGRAPFRPDPPGWSGAEPFHSVAPRPFLDVPFPAPFPFARSPFRREAPPEPGEVPFVAGASGTSSSVRAAFTASNWAWFTSEMIRDVDLPFIFGSSLRSASLS